MSSLSLSAAGAARQAIESKVPGLVEEQFASKLFDKDPTLWGPAAEEEAKIRLGWTEAATVSRPLVAEILQLRDDFASEGVTRFVLAGMGGSSLAPEVITRSEGVELFVLDSTDPEMVQLALQDLDKTALVVSSKSGSTVETDSARRAFVAAFEKAGIEAAADRGRDRSGVAHGRFRTGGRLPQGLQCRPQRGWPFLRAHRVRSGSLRLGRGRHRAAPGRRRGSRRIPQR